MNTIMRTIRRLFILLYSMPVTVMAAQQHAKGIGLVAESVLVPVGILTSFVSAACFIVGGSFLFASIIKYIEHRRSPLMVSISTVIFLVVAGAALVLLPLIMMYAHYIN